MNTMDVREKASRKKRLIDADVLLAEYDRQHEGEPGKARKLIEDAPTVDCPTRSQFKRMDVRMNLKLARLFHKWHRKRAIKKICKANNFNCSECIHHDHIFEGAVFRGTRCRLGG